ncbi:dihydrofolate reductase family protein [Nocardiopsis sp. MG754419]|uniref:dihydrofolate reductase family protein n=1 Tax=Nocardiopsis sp. MG754419 TaxID=2259865 RepID=UPI001BAAB4F2|nr:dihydrofolate reductase [Nocardiopsis sp. MG754419]MBR8742053.1 dihydrofolate reductase [Nocardiopsis sp. MG754419]
MRDLTYFVAVSLDGYVCGPDGSFDFFPNGDGDGELGEGGAFHVDEYPELLPTHVRTHLGVDAPHRHFDTMVQGRGSYQVALDVGVTRPYAHLREYVFSRTLPADLDPDVTIVSEDPLGTVRRLKEEDSDLGVCLVGGPSIAGVLLPEIDALMIKRYPVVAGSGKTFFEGAAFDPTAFTRVSGTILKDGSDYTLFRRASSGTT